MRAPRIGVVVAAGLVLLTSTACASAAEGGAPPPISPSESANAACASVVGGFAVSLALNHGGQLTPAAAAVFFAEHGGVAGYRAAVGSWKILPKATGGAGRSGGVTLRAGNALLHVVRLSDSTWAVDSGSHCAP